MAPSASQFIATAFAGTGPFSLPYTDHKSKRLIFSDLLSLFNEFPSLSPRASHYTNDDGTISYLLNATGTIDSTPLTIWLPPTYPFYPPPVFLSNTTATTTTIIQDHPFVNSTTRAVLTPYLLAWSYPHANLVNLARNLQRVFRLYSPLLSRTTTTIGISPSDLSHVSKQEAIDRLALALFFDIAGFHRQANDDINELDSQRAVLRDRRQQLEGGIIELERERLMLGKRADAVNSQIDTLQNWLEENQEVRSGEGEVEQIIECVDDESRVVFESSAADLAIEDVLNELDRAFQDGLVKLSLYMKYVRSLAREQFLCSVKHLNHAAALMHTSPCQPQSKLISLGPVGLQ